MKEKIGIAYLDTGIFGHPAFGQRILEFQDMVQGKIGLYDPNGHGTHVTGIAAGDGTFSKGRCMGVAPESGIIAIRILDHKGNGQIPHVLRAFQWILKNRKQYHIRIINISFGTMNYNSKRYKDLMDGVEEMWNQGFVVVTAAGNQGPDMQTITAPGNSPKVITVGCVDNKGKALEVSSTGPTRDCICKPDLVEHGYRVLSCTNYLSDFPYVEKTGTSMATPKVSGGIARLLDKDGYLSNVEIKMLLKSSTIDLGLPRNQQGWGLLSLDKLLNVSK